MMLSRRKKVVLVFFLFFSFSFFHRIVLVAWIRGGNNMASKHPTWLFLPVNTFGTVGFVGRASFFLLQAATTPRKLENWSAISGDETTDNSVIPIERFNEINVVLDVMGYGWYFRESWFKGYQRWKAFLTISNIYVIYHRKLRRSRRMFTEKFIRTLL